MAEELQSQTLTLQAGQVGQAGQQDGENDEEMQTYLADMLEWFGFMPPVLRVFGTSLVHLQEYPEQIV